MYKSFQVINNQNSKLVIWLLQIRNSSKSVLYKSKSYYEVLGVTRKANAKELKIAYYKKCKEFHPDRNKNDPNSHQKIVAINQAYSTLSDPTARSKYDLANSPNNSNFTYPHHQQYSEYYTRSNYYQDYYTDRMREEKMRYDSHNKQYYYKSNTSSYSRSQSDFKTPTHVIVLIAAITITIFMFDALFVNYTYQKDMDRMNQYYSPLNKVTQKELKAKMEKKLNKVDENEIDEQIRIYREYDETPPVRKHQTSS